MEHVGAYPFQVTSINPTSYYPLLVFLVVYIIRKENVNDKKYSSYITRPARKYSYIYSEQKTLL